MPALYLDAQGASLRKDGGEYVVHYKDTKQCFPQSQIERIILLGNIQLSTQVVADVLHHHIPVCFLSSKGQYRGRLTSTSHANVGLRLKQYDCIREDMLALPYARWFVIGKIRNAKELIGRKFNDMGLDSKPIRSRLKRWMDKAGRTHDMQRLRGFEAWLHASISNVSRKCLQARLLLGKAEAADHHAMKSMPCYHWVIPCC